MTDAGQKIDSKSIANKPEVLHEYFQKIPKPFSLAVESTYNWYYFVDLAERYAQEVFLANSYELKAFAKRHKKTDKIDARLIADVLRKGYLPSVTIPDKETRQTRELLRYRTGLVIDRSRCIFRLKALLDKLGIDSNGNFTTYKRLKKIPLETLPQLYQEVAKGFIERIEFLNEKIYASEKIINGNALNDPDILNLRTIPGIDYFSASLIKSEIINIGRFASFNRLCAYAGLAPRVMQSANKSIHGPLNTNRRKQLQWILLEVVYHFIKALPDKTSKYETIAQRKSANTAKVVLARDMLKIIYHVLKDKRPFYLMSPVKR
jgi:transposase